MLAHSEFVKRRVAVFIGNKILRQIPFATNWIMMNVFYLLL